MNTLSRLMIAVMSLLALGACEAVPAWQRGQLAKPEMAWSADSLESQFKDQEYYSKEASNGGGKAAGGGCGCN